ncbi:MAG: aminotransferase class V-fold PLP-dependent enzyme [Candidatus Aminicenantales bacterium]
MKRNLARDLSSIRREFPILSRCIYLVSHSLGAVPRKAYDGLRKYYALWAEEGVTAWQKEWWLLGQKIGNEIASFIGAGKNQVTMITNVTLCHWIVLSTQFAMTKSRRDTIVMTDHDFPSVIYAVTRIAQFMGWKVRMIRSFGQPGIDVEKILKQIDEQTLFVATSHVYFNSAFIQNIPAIVEKSRRVGALTLIDGYHGPGVIPLDVRKLGVDFYTGGCLKWLCGGPGNAFLYVRPELAAKLKPQLTGWFAHKNPFLFGHKMDYAQNSYKFNSGTPAIANFYTALAGLDIIKDIGILQIRNHSLRQTKLIINKARERGFRLFTPEKDESRGGSVSLALPHAFQVKQALEAKQIKLDFRKGRNAQENDSLRIGPHFYTKEDEIEILFEAVDSILATGEYRKFSAKLSRVT